MSDTCTCPKCQMENAYFDGVVFVCPDCGFEWEYNSEEIIFDDDEEDYSEFKELSILNTPFFNLEHGKLYDCKVEHEEGVDDTSIIPLAFKKDKNKQFMMTDARRLFIQNPTFVQEIIKMDYDYIYNDGIREDYPEEYEALTIIGTTRDDGTIIDNDDCVYFDFKKTDVL